MKKTLLSAVREYGIFDAKDVIEATGVSRETLTNWLKNKQKLFDIVCIGVKTKNSKTGE
jgi:AcrR family transcriptional regulator